VNPFGSNSPRFQKATSSNRNVHKQRYANNTLNINEDKHTKAEIIQKYLKDKSDGKQSFYFTSQTNRFDPRLTEKSKKFEVMNKVVFEWVMLF
jgi:hypothetical protein